MTKSYQILTTNTAQKQVPSSLPGENGALGDVGERIFSRVEAIDGVTGVVGAEPSC